MNANPIAPVNAQTAARFDAKFIEDHKLIDRYLEGKLPAKGARELENWCRANPAYLEALRLSERTQASLKLLEACGGPLDLTEPKPPWWKSPYVPIAGGVVALVCLLGFWALFGKYVLLRHELEDTRTRIHQGPLVQPAVPNAQTQIALFRKTLASSNASDALKSYDLVWLLHLVGDVHQPLHTTSRFTHWQPDGDAGGNRVALCQRPCRNELHAFWDDVPGTEKNPMVAIRRAAHLPTTDARVAAIDDERQWMLSFGRGKLKRAPM